ncbi:endolytic transglycosylase MltG [Paenimyroides tangerinum]|uniref:Endolytic murein transglycosylase n=1 Tax=Paenimyroides tangerinum TaxID=2488728 RepID=A0A3P3W9Z9_9FLAO|nr:endolytic transglycosylase MltG [Paenimyroides tangerinum]RRJ91975.1 endolytic transglycosylase MltG [Paenimyroides tangerinum]
MKLKNLVSILLVIVMSGLLIYGYKLYNKTFVSNTSFNEREVYITIPTNSTHEDIKKILTPYVKDFDQLDAVFQQVSFEQSYIPGRFLLKKGMSNYDLIQALKYNVPVKLTFNNQETIEKLVSRISFQIEPDSIALMNVFLEPEFLEENNFTKEDVLSMFIPNTYEFYWNTTPLKVRNQMHKEYTRFWNEERRTKAEKLGLTPTEVITLASIVQKETAKVDERPKVAGAYLNRLEKGMLLQADPTVVYSKKLLSNDFDQIIKRVYLKDLKLDSPYNTYMYKDLPPGPIAMPDISSVDAVLNPEKHNYIFFCASVERMGYHEFAENLAQHNVNRDKYSAWLDKNNIQ